MKDGRTHFSEKCEHAVDLDTSAVVSVTVQGADLGDTTTLDVTLEAAEANLEGVREKILEQGNSDPRDRGRAHKRDLIQKMVEDKGYHSSAVCARLKEQGIHPVISERKTGRRKWNGKRLEQSAVYANRANIRSNLGKSLMRKRGELVARAFTHYLDGGGMRHVWLKGHDNILKRLLIQVAGFNLGLLMRKAVGAGTPRGGGALKKAFEGIFWAFKDHFKKIPGLFVQFIEKLSGLCYCDFHLHWRFSFLLGFSQDSLVKEKRLFFDLRISHRKFYATNVNILYRL